jgi:hypothetical protein
VQNTKRFLLVSTEPNQAHWRPLPAGAILRELKVVSFLPNYGFYGLQQVVAASGEPSGIDDLVVRPDTRLSDRRKTRIPSNERWPPN